MNKGPHIVLITGRMIAASIALWGAYHLANQGKEGWGWLIFVAIVLGGVTLTESKGETTVKG